MFASGFERRFAEGRDLVHVLHAGCAFDTARRIYQGRTCLQDRLGKLKDAMVAEDTSAICDCLLYELPEATRDWRIILAGLAGRFDTACKSNS